MISSTSKSLMYSYSVFLVVMSEILINAIIADISGNYITINFTKIQYYKL